MKVIALALLFVGASVAQDAPIPPSPGFPPCNVCDANDPTVRVTNDDFIVEIDGQEPTSCFNFQRAGDNGFIEAGFCPAVVGFLTGCECMVIPATPAPVTAAPVTAAPVMAPLPPSPGFPACNVCNANDPTIRVTNNDFIVEIEGQNPTTCFNFQRAGDNGFIEETFCPAVVGFLAGCECMAPGTEAPVAPVVPTTPAPVTPAPVTAAPVTAAPVMAPLPPSPGFPACNVCDANDLTVRVTNNTAIVEIDGQPPTSCFNFQRAGDFGFIEAAFCPAVVGFLADCDCMAPATPAPVTPAPVTAAPVTPAPVTPAPVTAAPVTPAPVTPAPVTPAPVTPAPVTPAPVTAAPVTPAPVTAAPVTPAPVTAAPVTAAPVTAAPVTAAPVTPAPVTAAPITPAPVTPAPVTAAPVTPAPVTAAPVVPLTPAPVTQAPAEAPAGMPVMAPVMMDKKGKNKMKGNKDKKMMMPVEAPVTAAPVTAAPVAADPVTAAPVADPVTAAPVAEDGKGKGKKNKGNKGKRV